MLNYQRVISVSQESVWHVQAIALGHIVWIVPGEELFFMDVWLRNTPKLGLRILSFYGWLFIHGSSNVPIEHHPTIRYMVYNGYYKVMSNSPKMGHLPTPVYGWLFISGIFLGLFSNVWIFDGKPAIHIKDSIYLKLWVSWISWGYNQFIGFYMNLQYGDIAI